MNVLIVGSGKGSWTMRGLQLGGAIGARVTSSPTDADWHWAEVAVLVKRAGPTFAAQAHAHKVPVVWDALDFWAQPNQNSYDMLPALQLLSNTLKVVRPALAIGATEAMAQALGGVYLPHHSWAGLTPTAARPAVQTVAYDGNASYLGSWQRVVEKACQARGWSFVVNPPDLSAADLIVAFRDGPWDGWICREWKSGVKVGNAIAAGRPIIGQATAARRELTPPGSIVEQPEELNAAFEEWSGHRVRESAVHLCRVLAPELTLEAVARRYTTLLQEQGVGCGA